MPNITRQLPADSLLDALPRWGHWELGSASGEGVVVAVVDSGCDPRYADGRILRGYTVRCSATGERVVTSGDATDMLGHGTACTSLVLSVAPRARVIPIRVFESRLETSVKHVAHAIRLAAELGADVVNLSLGTVCRDEARTLYESCEAANRAGTIVVAAGRKDAISFPAVFDNVIGVLADTFSSRLEFCYCRMSIYEFFACGQTQPVMWTGGTVDRKAGDSVAAANLSGVVARCRQLLRRATISEVRAYLSSYSTPPPLTRRHANQGRVDRGAELERASAVTPGHEAAS